MASKSVEAKIVISAQDDTSATVDRIHSKLMSMGGPLAGMRDKLANAFPHAQVAKFEGAMAGLNTKLATVGLGMAGVAVGGMAMAKAGFDSIVATAEKADRISDLGGRLQLNAEQFQVFEKLAKESGASVEEVGGAFMKFRLNLQQATSEGGDKLAKLNKNLAAFGITAQDMQSMKPIDIMKLMGKVSAASGTEKDELLKLQLFRDLAGKTGATLIPVFEAIGTSYDATVQKMRAAGVLMTDDMAKRGGEAFESWERAQNAFGGLKMAFGIEMMPVFEKFSSVLEKRMKANRTAMMPGIQEMANQLTTQVEPFLDSMDKMAKSASGMFKVLSKVASVVGWDTLVLGGLTLIAAPFIAAAWSVTASLWGIGAAIYTAAGGQSLTALRNLAAVMQLTGVSALRAWTMVLLPYAAIAAVAGLVLVNLGNIWDYFGGFIDRIGAAYRATGLFGAAWQTVKELAMAPLNAMIGALNTILNLLAKVGIGSGGNISLVGGAQGEAATRATQAAWGNEGRGAIPATAPATSRSEVSGRMVVEVKDGRTDVKSVQTDSKNFNIDALAGGMFATGA